MKQRILTGCVIAVFFAVMMACIHTPLFEIIVAFLAVMAVYEIHKVAQIKNKSITVVSLVFSAFVPLTYMGYEFDGLISKIFLALRHNFAICAVWYVLTVLILMLAQYHRTRFEHVAISVFSAIVIPQAFSVLMWLRDIDMLPEYSQKAEGIFFILLSFSCSWVTDMFAYFTGRAFGKHKLCPNISPKKTVEGAVGGVLLTMVLNIGLLFVFNRYFFTEQIIPYWLIAVTSVVLSILSMCGDLSASTIKRNYGVKDFGKLLPGHGGIMDRFDSCLFVWPCLYCILKIYSVVMEF